MTPGTAIGDEFDEYLAQLLLQSPSFARAYHRAAAASPRKLPIDGHEYRRRRRARKRRKRGR